MSKTYRKSVDIHSCRLVKDDLLKLMEIIKEGIPHSTRKEDLDISTSFRNINISENSIEDFLEHKELPEYIDILTIRIIGWNEDRDIDKTVDITFYQNFITLNVHGTDETWVLGKYVQLSEFLRRRRPWFWFVNNTIFYLFLGMIIPVGIAGLVYFIKEGAIPASISTLIFLVAWILVFVFNLNNRLFPHVQIIFTPKKSFITRENFTILIMVLTFFIILGQLIISLSK